MPVSAIITTPGSAVANSYCDVATADQYHLDRVPPQAGAQWAALTPDAKAQGLLWATRLLDNLYEWNGYAVDAVQVLMWPRGAMLKRTGWEYVDTHVIPPELVHATAEYARQLIVADRAADSDVETQKITSVKAGSVAVTFGPGVTAKQVPDAVVLMLPPYWGYPRNRNGSVRQLVRV